MFRQYIAIQLVPSDCSMYPPVGNGLERSKTPMLSRPRNPPSKILLPVGVLAIHPPGEIHQQFVKDAFQKRIIRACRRACGRSETRASRPRRAPEDSRRRTPTHRPESARSDACTIRAETSCSCALREIRIHHRQRDHVERQIPRRVPRIFPGVRHRDDVFVEQVHPLRVAAVQSRSRGGVGWPGSPFSQSSTTK